MRHLCVSLRFNKNYCFRTFDIFHLRRSFWCDCSHLRLPNTTVITRTESMFVYETVRQVKRARGGAGGEERNLEIGALILKLFMSMPHAHTHTHHSFILRSINLILLFEFKSCMSLLLSLQKPKIHSTSMAMLASDENYWLDSFISWLFFLFSLVVTAARRSHLCVARFDKYYVLVRARTNTHTHTYAYFHECKMWNKLSDI